MTTILTVDLTIDEEKIQKIIEKYIEEHDVVEVVRCVDCKWYNHGFCGNLDKITENEHYRVEVAEDEYCSDGER